MSSLLKGIIFGKSKHKKLPEEWGSSIKQPVNEGMRFYVKYLGSTLVVQPSSETVTAEAIKNIIYMAKLSGKKLPRVSLTVKPSGIITEDVQNNEKLIDVSIYRISYCSADATYDRVVAFIATNKNETFECHAFLTSKKKVAQAAALTISQAFAIAFDRWQNNKKGNKQDGDKHDGKKEIKGSESSDKKNHENQENEQVGTLIDLSFEETPSTQGLASFPTADGRTNSHSNANGSVVKQLTSHDSNVDDSFSWLAKSRSAIQTDVLLPTNHHLDLEEMNAYFSEPNPKDDKFFSDQDDFFAL